MMSKKTQSNWTIINPIITECSD